ncbi:MAG: hypothetical protein ACRD1U_19085 [Vicinamibacterales bacterium]
MRSIKDQSAGARPLAVDTINANQAKSNGREQQDRPFHEQLLGDGAVHRIDAQRPCSSPHLRCSQPTRRVQGVR